MNVCRNCGKSMNVCRYCGKKIKTGFGYCGRCIDDNEREKHE